MRCILQLMSVVAKLGSCMTNALRVCPSKSKKITAAATTTAHPPQTTMNVAVTVPWTKMTRIKMKKTTTASILRRY